MTLFALFLADLEKFLLYNGARGVSIDDRHEVLVLAYADDLILLSDTPFGLNQTLRLLTNYCDTNRLIVNTKKTTVMIFHRGVITDLKKRLSFRFGDERLEIVDQYKYLGVIFKDTGMFVVAASAFVRAARSATGSVHALLNKMNYTD